MSTIEDVTKIPLKDVAVIVNFSQRQSFVWKYFGSLSVKKGSQQLMLKNKRTFCKEKENFCLTNIWSQPPPAASRRYIFGSSQPPKPIG